MTTNTPNVHLDSPLPFRMDPRISAIIRHLPRPADAALRRWCYPALLLAQNRRMRIKNIRGATRTGQVSVVVAGPDPWAGDLPRRIFRGCPHQIDLGEVPIHRLGAALDSLVETAHLVMARVDTLSARFCFGPDYLRVPEWIDTVLPVPQDLNALVKSNHSLREDMRLVRHSGLEAAISNSDEDFEAFYTTMYVPFIRARHGALTWQSNRESLFKCFRRGGLIFLRQARERVAAILFEQQGDTMHLPAEGTRGGDTGLLKSGTVSALFYHAIRHAKESGCRLIDFGGCRACLSDGVLRYKRKWGMELRVRPTNCFFTMVRWKDWNPGVATFLADAPVLHQEGAHLTAISAAGLSRPGTQADSEGLFERLNMRGLNGIQIINEAGWVPGVTPRAGTVLTSGAPRPHELTAP